MNDKAKIAIAFITGTAIGAASAYFYLKDKYEAFAQEEIESVKKRFASRVMKEVTDNGSESDPPDRVVANESRNKPDIIAYANALKKRGYTNYSGHDMEASQEEIEKRQQELENQKNNGVEDEDDEEHPVEEVVEKNIFSTPYIISPEDFGEATGYSTISLTYYADGIVADDADDMVDDVDDIIGFDSLNHFGEFEENLIFVRNEKYGVDYEVSLDTRRFADVAGRGLYPTED